MPDKRPALFAQGDVPRLVDLRHTSAFRLTAAFGAVFVLAMVVVVGLIYVLTADELSQRIDGMIALRTQRLIERPQAQLPGAIREVIKETRGGTEFYALLSADGRPIVSNMAIERPFPIHLPFDRRASPPGLPLRLLALRAPSGELLVVGRDFTAVHDLRDRVLVITGLCGAGAI
ncbi:MAG TPA: sensor histidine kinase, partial [Novosphingobium sp.]|nr:sensor histidine kinase [Novosphingobium sp.]